MDFDQTIKIANGWTEIKHHFFGKSKIIEARKRTSHLPDNNGKISSYNLKHISRAELAALQANIISGKVQFSDYGKELVGSLTTNEELFLNIVAEQSGDPEQISQADVLQKIEETQVEAVYNNLEAIDLLIDPTEKALRVSEEFFEEL